MLSFLWGRLHDLRQVTFPLRPVFSRCTAKALESADDLKSVFADVTLNFDFLIYLPVFTYLYYLHYSSTNISLLLG